jgi:hypothetical protein
LCEFLDVPVPEETFPHVNDSGSIRDLVEKTQREGKFTSPFES